MRVVRIVEDVARADVFEALCLELLDDRLLPHAVGLHVVSVLLPQPHLLDAHDAARLERAAQLAEELRRAVMIDDMLRPAGNVLARFTRDLTAEARAGRLEPVRCRGDEIARVIDILLRHGKNNPALVSDEQLEQLALEFVRLLNLFVFKPPMHGGKVKKFDDAGGIDSFITTKACRHRPRRIA